LLRVPYTDAERSPLNFTAVRHVSTFASAAAGGFIDQLVAPRSEWEIEFIQWILNQNLTFSFKCTQSITRQQLRTVTAVIFF